ncbi:MAG: hypothetical protein ACREDR_23150, partial [Blastocatellia bacterium]
MTRTTKGRKKEVPSWNRSPSGWWVASYLERFEFEDEEKKNLNRRCVAWENTIIIKARNREEAFRKAEKAGRLVDGIEGYSPLERPKMMGIGPLVRGSVLPKRRGVWRYEGLTSLLPIYEDLQDGAEIIWQEHKNVTV